eukprot:6275645-Pyramimonas_sp.AAC.1
MAGRVGTPSGLRPGRWERRSPSGPGVRCSAEGVGAVGTGAHGSLPCLERRWRRRGGQLSSASAASPVGEACVRGVPSSPRCA